MMDPLALDGHSEGIVTASRDKDGDNDGSQICTVMAMSPRVESTGNRPRVEEQQGREVADDDASKRKKKKENEEKEPLGRPVLVARTATGRILTGTKQPGPASKTGATPLGKSGVPQSTNKGGAGPSGKGNPQSQARWGGAGAKTNSSSAQGKSGGKVGAGSQVGKQDGKIPALGQLNQAKDGGGDGDDQKNYQPSAPKVPPLKIVIPGGAGGTGSKNEPEGEGGAGPRGGGKGRGGAPTLPYVLPCTSAVFGQAYDASDLHDEKRSNENTKAGPRVLRSHRTNDREREHKERTAPQKGAEGRSGTGRSRSLSSNKSPRPSGSGQDNEHAASTSSRSESVATSGPAAELGTRKRKMKASKESHSRDLSKGSESAAETSHAHTITHPNPYQMFIHIRNQIANRQKGLFPVKPKPPKDFNKYLMNRRTYTLQSNVNEEPQVQVPDDLPPPMLQEFLFHEKERTRLRIQHLVEKEKLVLAVEQEILRVHGRAERAVANQPLPFSVCTMLRDTEVYNLMAPEQEEKRNAQRSRCNGRQINSWLQEVDDKWEKIKEGMLRRQHTEAESLYAVQSLGWEWGLKGLGLFDNKSAARINPRHVPQIHVSNFDLPA